MCDHDYQFADMWEKLLLIFETIEFKVASCFDGEIIPDFQSITKPMLYDVLIKAEKETEDIILRFQLDI
jgi:hypothetical protein